MDCHNLGSIEQAKKILLRSLIKKSFSAMPIFIFEAAVCGYHVYKDVWNPCVGEEFPAKRERGMQMTDRPFA